jgi:hypothetical protein
MAPEPGDQRTRRAILVGGLSAAAVSVVSAIARPLPSVAYDSQPVTVGDSFTGTRTTKLDTQGHDVAALWGHSKGNQGVLGTTDSGTGVHGLSSSFTGVEGSSVSGVGVAGESTSGDGVAGGSESANGVHGQSSSGNGVYGVSFSPTASGVYGETDHRGYGVAGRTNAGPLVSGAGAAGALGDNTADGIGVWARSAHGTALFAEAVDTGAIAMSAKGASVFSGPNTFRGLSSFAGVTTFTRSGKLTVSAGTRHGTQTGISISAASVVLTTIVGATTGIYILGVVPNLFTRSFTVTLSKNVASDTLVGWFVVN